MCAVFFFLKWPQTSQVAFPAQFREGEKRETVRAASNLLHYHCLCFAISPTGSQSLPLKMPPRISLQLALWPKVPTPSSECIGAIGALSPPAASRMRRDTNSSVPWFLRPPGSSLRPPWTGKHSSTLTLSAFYALWTTYFKLSSASSQSCHFSVTTRPSTPQK